MVALEPLSNESLADLIGSGSTGEVATLQSDGSIDWGADETLLPGNLVQRNGLTPTEHILHGTYTAADDYERLRIYGDGSNYYIASEAGASGGVSRPLQINNVGIAGSSTNRSLALGYEATYTSSNAVAIGWRSTSSTRGVSVGTQSDAGQQGTAIGFQALAHVYGIALGREAEADSNAGIAIGIVTYAPGQTLAVGCPSDPSLSVTASYFGSGYQSTNPQDHQINATRAEGADVAGAALRIAGGRGTGAATPGDLILQTASVGSSGDSLQSLVDRVVIKGGDGSVIANSGVGMFGVTPPAVQPVHITDADGTSTDNQRAINAILALIESYGMTAAA